MKNYIIVCSAILSLFLDISLANTSKKYVDIPKIVKSVNNNKYLPWKADSYGQSKVDVKEFVKTRLGVTLENKYTSPYEKSSPKDVIKQATLQPADSDYIGLPINFTWANKTLTKCPIGIVRDQSNCGSCWAVSTAAALGDRFCIQGKGNKILSHEYIVACDTANKGCWGGYMYRVNSFMVTNGTITGGEYDSDEGCQQYSIRPCGFPLESSMVCDYSNAYNPKCKNRKCNNDWYQYKYEPDSNVFKAESYTIISANYTHSREDRIRDEIYRNGPVTAAFYVLQDFMTYKKGVYVPSPRAWYAGGHAVRVIGWGVENGLKYWHAVNSWGDKWGEEGFFKFIRGVNMCGFESSMTAFYLPKNSTA